MLTRLRNMRVDAPRKPLLRVLHAPATGMLASELPCCRGSNPPFSFSLCDTRASQLPKRQWEDRQWAVPPHTHTPLNNNNICAPRLRQIVSDLAPRLSAGECIYLHGSQGAGRPGVVGACLLAALYG